MNILSFLFVYQMWNYLTVYFAYYRMPMTGYVTFFAPAASVIATTLLFCRYHCHCHHRKFCELCELTKTDTINDTCGLCNSELWWSYSSSSLDIRCFSLAWLAEYSARRRASRKFKFSTVFSSFMMPDSMESWLRWASRKKALVTPCSSDRCVRPLTCKHFFVEQPVFSE